MSDVIINAKVGVSGVNNGAMVTFVRETGGYERLDPYINQYVPSGATLASLDKRFDETYGFGINGLLDTASTTITSGTATSTFFDTYNKKLAGVWFPDTFTGSAISFLSSTTFNGTYIPVNKTDTSSLYTVPASSGKYQPVDFNNFNGIRYLKIVSSIAESGNRSLTLSLKV